MVMTETKVLTTPSAVEAVGLDGDSHTIGLRDAAALVTYVRIQLQTARYYCWWHRGRVKRLCDGTY